MAKKICIYIKGNEEEIYKNPIIDSIKQSFNLLLENVEINNQSINGQLFEKCAGHILEEYIKSNLSNISSPDIKRHFTLKDNKYYDFKYDLYNVKILTFNESKEYSDNYLSRKQLQYADTNDLMFLCIIYTINENTIRISNIKFVDGSSLFTTNAIYKENDKVIYSKLIEGKQQESSIEEEDILPIKMIFTSNLEGEVQIINI